MLYIICVKFSKIIAKSIEVKKARCYTTARQRESSEAPENLYDKVEENDLTYRPKAGCGCVRAAAAAFGKGLGEREVHKRP